MASRLSGRRMGVTSSLPQLRRACASTTVSIFTGVSKEACCGADVAALAIVIRLYLGLAAQHACQGHLQHTPHTQHACIPVLVTGNAVLKKGVTSPVSVCVAHRSRAGPWQSSTAACRDMSCPRARLTGWQVRRRAPARRAPRRAAGSCLAAGAAGHLPRAPALAACGCERPRWATRRAARGRRASPGLCAAQPPRQPRCV